MKSSYFFWSLFLFVACFLPGFAEELPGKSILPLKKEPKVLVLIIASSGTEAYLELEKVWQGYMHLDPEHFEVYFIRGEPELPAAFKIQGDDLIVKSKESFVPGILEKTILSMEAMLPRLNEFDYVLRTNLSSFYVFPRLLNFIKTLPKQQCYCGIQLHLVNPHPKYPLINFVSGAGILLSTDMVELLVREKENIFKTSDELPDDVLLGLFFQQKHIPSMSAPRTDFPTRAAWDLNKDQIAEGAFHFRAKYSYNIRTPEDSFADEIFIDKELLKMFYPQPL